MEISAALRSAIYKYIDENGFRGRYSSPIYSLALDEEEGSLEKLPRLSSFKVSIPFDLTPEEQLEIVNEYINDLTGIGLKDMNDIDQCYQLDGKPFIFPFENDNSDQFFCIGFKVIPGRLVVRKHHKLDSLGIIEKVMGDLGFSDCLISDLGSLQEVIGSFWIAQDAKHFTLLKSLKPLRTVGGDLNLKQSPVVDLATIETVGGNLNLRNTQVESLGSLRQVGGNVLVSDHLDLDFSKVSIGGKVKTYKDVRLPDL